MDTLLKTHTEEYKTSFSHITKGVLWVFLRLKKVPIVTAWIIFSSLSIASAENLNTTTESSISDYFIEFNPGNYQQPTANSLDVFIQRLYSTYANHHITLIGKSESRKSLASQQLALNRAIIIKKQLVKKGINANQIIVSGEYKNLKNEGDLQHGVVVSVSPAKEPDKQSIPTDLSSDTLNLKTSKIAFVEFLPSQYRQPIPNEIQRLLRQLRRYPNTTKIKIVGISQSKTTLATDALAHQRAKTVASSLVSSGISAERLVLDAEATNFVDNEHLTHGVYIYINSKNHSNKTFAVINEPASKQQLLNAVIEQISQDIKSENLEPEEVANLKISPPPINTQLSTAIDLCSELTIKKGSLKTNIQREIADCGYLMGDWNFGTDVELIDWLIPIAYSVKVEKGIFGVLNLIEENYQIRAHVHQLDKSIDFLASIKHDRGQ